ncbi:MAG: hypothetical protein F6J93_03615 [Oscillatoria sp. SIO1A7]|nr:hypothetical protein [Oscillatoria sp. SIO1A7]
MLTPSWNFVNSVAQKLEGCGKHCAAKTLRYLYNRLQRQLADNKSDSPKKYWLLVSQQKIVEKLNGEYKITAVRSALNLLIELGIVIRDRQFDHSGKGWRYLLAAQLSDLSELIAKPIKPTQGEPKPELPPRSEPKPELPPRSEPKQEFSETSPPSPPPPPPPPGHPTFNVRHLTLTDSSNPCAERDSGARANIIRSKSKNNIESIDKLTHNKLEIPEKKRTRENPLPKPTKQKSKSEKSGKAKNSRWGQKFRREFDEKFRDIVTKYLSDSCTPKNIARSAFEGIDRSRECEINDTVIDYCVRAGADIVRKAIAVCKRDMEKNFIKKPAAFLVRKIQGLLASEGLLAEEEYPRQPQQDAATLHHQEPCETPEKNPPQEAEAAIANWPERSEADRTGDKAIPQPHFQTHHLSNPYPEGDKAMDKTHLRFQTHHLSNVCRRPDGRIDKALVLWLFELRRKQFDTANQFDVENELNNDGDKASRAWEDFREEMTQRVLNFSERLAAASANPEHARNFLADREEVAAIAPYAYLEQISDDALFFLAPYIDIHASRPPGINDSICARIKAIAINSRQQQESLLTASSTRPGDAESLAAKEVEQLQSIPELPDGSDHADNSLGGAALEEPTEKYGNPQQNLARLAKMVSSVKVNLSGSDTTEKAGHLTTKQQTLALEAELLNRESDDALAQKKAEARLMWQQFYADREWVNLPPTRQQEPDAAKIQRLWSDPGLREGLIRAIDAHPQWGLRITADGLELDF